MGRLDPLIGLLARWIAEGRVTRVLARAVDPLKEPALQSERGQATPAKMRLGAA